MDNKIIWRGLWQALGMSAYIGLISWLMFNGEAIFGSDDKSFLIPVVMLSLFSLSAAFLFILMFGKAITMYLDGAKKEAIKLVIVTCAWFAIITLVVLISQIIK